MTSDTYLSGRLGCCGTAVAYVNVLYSARRVNKLRNCPTLVMRNNTPTYMTIPLERTSAGVQRKRGAKPRGNGGIGATDHGRVGTGIHLSWLVAVSRLGISGGTS